MNALEQFHQDLDHRNWDVLQGSDINHALQEVNSKLFEAGLYDLSHFAEVERQAFLLNKLPEKRLSYRIAGLRATEDGSEVPFVWPDIREFKKEDFDYLYKRFTEAKNTYAKTEYGLVLFYSKYKLDNNFVIELLEALFELLKIYIKKAMCGDDNNRYVLYAQSVLDNALHIAHNRKAEEDVSKILTDLIHYTFEIHQKWELTNSSTLGVIRGFTNFAAHYVKEFKETIKMSKLLERNKEAAEVLSKFNVFGAIYIADASIGLSRKLKADINYWLHFKAAQYERLADERKDDLASVSFIEKAMDIYRGLKDEANLSRLQNDYQKKRTEFYLSEINVKMPESENEHLLQLIMSEVEEKSEKEIVEWLVFTPMIRPLSEIKHWSEEAFKEQSLQNILPVNIQDKFGNTVAQFKTGEERQKLSLLRTFDFHMQIAVQTLVLFFMEAFRSGKVSAKGIINYLSLTWMGEEAVRRSHGREMMFSYLRLIESGVNSFFDELLKWKEDPDYLPNFVSSTDSLTVKVEYFLREFCYFLGIPTFKQNPKNQSIIMEKTLDDLLNDLEDKLSEDDHFFIKFILTEKAGYNLRNRIAHGLMDDNEYALEFSLLALIIILKLSSYEFIPTKNK